MISQKTLILTLAIIAIQVLAASNDTSLICGGATDTNSYNRGDTAIICVQIKGLGKKIPFQVTVDQYAGLNLKGTYNTIKSLANFSTQAQTANGFQLVVQSFQNSIQSDALTYIRQDTPTAGSTTTPYVFPIFSAVIQITNGKITGIDWDNGCWNGSSPTVCKQLTVSTLDSKGNQTTYSESNNYITDCTNNSTDGSCDPKVYISWMGTDSNGNYMTSAGLRMSRFQSYSVGEFYQSSKSAFSGISI
ncbi:hypothetical protein TTHERM_000727808 (macronuclear) [Tetrahymena thermophila SB210]|uniref:Uncharacterized protein n=1 Tax=Tetrahymena thermophila (strain SB210) TaxID=312017 RepID=W7XHP1_TETTS|nr:hypothetical protein TTHERM_000727808 [Tetrahymena thermophila SB210]EWS72669.1 hypothetical protein TTHERM_000727808 [Tetrahymena thermophila SB210]|eukprot:XP_012654794.1 hypothetical protein TTHERM_000727808 [Tetrahymena thermophila SB210]